MLAKSRQDEILDIILHEGKASIADLADRFNVTTETVRRDLSLLSENERIHRVHGGAVLVPAVRSDRDYALRKATNIPEKQKIGLTASTYVHDGDAIFIDEGSAAAALAEALTGKHDLQIVTCSLDTATVIAEKLKNHEITGALTLLGGTVDPDTQSTFGMQTLEQIEKMNFSATFFGATAITEEGIFFWYTARADLTRRAVLKSGKRICLAESEKFGTTSFCLCTGFENVDVCITDNKNKIPDAVLRAMEDNGADLKIVEA